MQGFNSAELNSRLREAAPQRLARWLPYTRLLFSALYNLPDVHGKVYRAVEMDGEAFQVGGGGAGC